MKSPSRREGARTAHRIEKQSADDRHILEKLDLLRCTSGAFWQTPKVVSDDRCDHCENDKDGRRYSREHAEQQCDGTERFDCDSWNSQNRWKRRAFCRQITHKILEMEEF